MKIVFSDLPMKKELHGFKYKVDGNATIEYDGETIFPVNSVLAKTMKKGEKVKVVLLSKVDIEGNSAINAGKFQKELKKDKETIYEMLKDEGRYIRICELVKKRIDKSKVTVSEFEQLVLDLYNAKTNEECEKIFKEKIIKENK